MKVETAKRLHDVARACQELLDYCRGRTRQDLLTDRTLQLVVQKLIEIVGEALHQAGRTDVSLSRKIPNLRDIVDTRNRIVHGYESVDYSLLWDIVQDDIPPLLVLVRDLLRDAPDVGPPRQT